MIFAEINQEVARRCHGIDALNPKPGRPSEGLDGSLELGKPVDGRQEGADRGFMPGPRYRSDELSETARALLLVDLPKDVDLHIDERVLDCAWSHQLHEGWKGNAGADHIRRAKVCRKRCGLAILTPVVCRWWRNSERKPAGVIRAPRAGPF